MMPPQTNSKCLGSSTISIEGVTSGHPPVFTLGFDVIESERLFDNRCVCQVIKINLQKIFSLEMELIWVSIHELVNIHQNLLLLIVLEVPLVFIAE